MTSSGVPEPLAEEIRLEQDARREENWTRWGPYLSERQWATVREDYSAQGDPWNYFPHEHARSRVYRWGEDGLLGICDRQARLCFALALWNGKDPILKERLFGLSAPEGNHGEDVKELYYYLDATPTSSFLRALYKYPQAAFPYARLVDENSRRNRFEPEFEITEFTLGQRGVARKTDHVVVRIELTALVGVGQGGKQLAPGQITRRTEDHEHCRIRVRGHRG